MCAARTQKHVIGSREGEPSASGEQIATSNRNRRAKVNMPRKILKISLAKFEERKQEIGKQVVEAARVGFFK